MTGAGAATCFGAGAVGSMRALCTLGGVLSDDSGMSGGPFGLATIGGGTGMAGAA
jgi:hypothetical protein